jgi:hypothetical protein
MHTWYMPVVTRANQAHVNRTIPMVNPAVAPAVALPPITPYSQPFRSLDRNQLQAL